MKNAVLLGILVGTVISLFVAAIGFWHLPVSLGQYFVIIPGLLSYMAASDMLQKPPVAETFALCLAINVVVYTVLCIAMRHIYIVAQRFMDI
jgi:ABC-type uncharacterized transport system permease subunit